MAFTQKAYEFAQYLAEELKLRLALDVETGFEADETPFVNVGAGVAEGKNAYLQVAPISSLFKNIVGHTQDVFTPHVIKVCIEATKADGTEPLSTLLKAQLLSAVFAKGTKVEIYESPTGTAPVAAEIKAANLKGVVEPNLQYPMVSTQ